MIRFEIEQISTTRLEDLLDEAPCGFVQLVDVTPNIDEEGVCMLLGRLHSDTDYAEFISLDDGCHGKLPLSTAVVPLDITVKVEPAKP